MGNVLGLRHRAVLAVILLAAVGLYSSGCTGATSLTADSASDLYSVEVRLDPLTLNPPQLGTLSFSVTDAKTNKAVTQFEPVLGALVHNIIIRKDLQFFRHDTAQKVVANQVSVPAFFPTFGTYFTYSLYKPTGAVTQTLRSTIVSGSESEAADLEPQRLRDEQRIPAGRPDRGLSVSKLTNGLSVSWIKGAEPVKSGVQTQLLFHITENGVPVTSLWPLYDAPGHLWLVDERGDNFTHLQGASQSRALLPSPTPAEGTTLGQGSSSEPNPREIPAGGGTPVPPPTLIPPLRNALSTVTAVPYPTLLPVQQTPLGGLAAVEDVRPAIGYGPDMVFAHTFPNAGLYKMWLELKWRDNVITSDFVVQVEP